MARTSSGNSDCKCCLDLFSCLCVHAHACVCTRTGQTLCNPMDCSLPRSSVHGIFQARILEPVPFPSLGDLPNPGIKPVSLASSALAGWLSLSHLRSRVSSVGVNCSVVSNSLWFLGQEPVRLVCLRDFPRDSHVKVSELYDSILRVISVILMMECDVFSYIAYITLYVIRNKEKHVLFLLDFFMIGFDFVPFFRAAVCPVTSILW